MRSGDKAGVGAGGGAGRGPENGRPARPEERVDTATLIAFFRGPVLPVALGLFMLPPLLGLIGILLALFG